MNKIILLFIIFLLLQFTSLAQEGWYLQPISNTNSLNEVWAMNENIALVVGDNGSILKTTDGGLNWVTKNSDTLYFLLTICFVDNNVGWATGSHGKILKTNDGGETWVDVSFLPLNYTIVSICFPDANSGWFLAPYEESAPPHIYRTTDGGINWTLQGNLFSSFQTGHSIYFLDEMNGWGVASNEIISTTNGGEDWFTQYYDDHHHIFDIFFIDINNGWAVGLNDQWPGGSGGFLLQTSDGGTTWIEKLDSLDVPLNSVYFVNNDIGWAVGGIWGTSLPTILKTTNGGTDWFNQNPNTLEGLGSVHFADENIGWAVGTGGTILHTTNGGISLIEEEQIDEMPTAYSLSNNFPNPFNPSTKIQYSIPQSADVVIKVFDILGNEIETLVNEEKQTGTYEITWYAANLLPKGSLTSGVYFYQLKAGNFIQTKKMLLLK